MQLGFNSTHLSADSTRDNWEFKGGGASLALALGAALDQHFILYGEFFVAGSSSPDVNHNGATAGTVAGGGSDVYGIGPGMAYYFEPVNIFVAATLALAKVRVYSADDTNLQQSKWGAALEVLLGKEWWVSDNWSLGVSGQMILGTMNGEHPVEAGGQIPTWKVTSFSLLFSTTYN
jgi:hypothetical protein